MEKREQTGGLNRDVLAPTAGGLPSRDQRPEPAEDPTVACGCLCQHMILTIVFMPISFGGGVQDRVSL